MGCDGEDLSAAARQQHLVVADMADQHAAVGDIGARNALRQVGASGLGGGVSHLVLR
jgi:hypothetical protein